MERDWRSKTDTEGDQRSMENMEGDWRRTGRAQRGGPEEHGAGHGEGPWGSQVSGQASEHLHVQMLGIGTVTDISIGIGATLVSAKLKMH